MPELSTPTPNLSPCKGERSGRSSTARKIGVVGGGWAGCAAAVELSRNGCDVTLFEAARTLGGRARRVDLNGLPLDNGQHIMLGAYAETLRLLRLLDIAADDVLLRLPLQMRYPGSGGMDFVAPRLPAPLHMLAALLRARGLDYQDKLSLARFSTTARWMDWLLHDDCSVTELLQRFDQTERLIRLMWRPLCIAALNTPPERASAQVFLNVLRDSLGARRRASDMLLPKTDLSALLPQRAAAFIEAHGGSVRLGTAVRALRDDAGSWQLDTGTWQCFDALVIATHPAQAVDLLDGITDTTGLAALTYEPISTCYLQYDDTLRLAAPFFALQDDATCRHWGQFVFDRGWLDPQQAGLLAVVVSASSAAIEAGNAALTGEITAQLTHELQMPALATPRWSRLITEKRATFSCTPRLRRPPNETACKRLVLAGDYTACDYPATLESAVRSGLQAAQLLLTAS